MYRRTPSTTPSRYPERARYDQETVHSILDECLVGHLGFVADGRPQVLPMLFVREGSSLFLHGSTGAHPARMAARGRGLDVCFEATLVDGLVLARSTFNHSVNYRTVVVHGTAALVSDPSEKRRVLDLLVSKVVPGRAADARPPDDGELRQTAVLELPIVSVSAKVRSGGPKDDERDLSSPCWAGVVPMLSGRGVPVPAADLAEAVGLPAYLSEAVAMAPGAPA